MVCDNEVRVCEKKLTREKIGETLEQVHSERRYQSRLCSENSTEGFTDVRCGRSPPTRVHRRPAG